MSRSSRVAGRRDGVRAGLLLVLAAGAAAVVVAGMVWWPTATDGADEAVEEFMHVHGVAVPPWDAEAVHVSTHQGLIRIDEDDRWRWVGERRHDFMGFSAHPTEDGVLYSSGHPEPGSELPNPIGFMVTADGGETWQPRALTGEVDFHAMATGPDGEAVYGWNVAGEGGLHRSLDGGETWERPAAAALSELGGVFALAVSPVDPEELWAGTEPGLLRSDDAGESWEPVHTSGPTTAVAFDPSDADRALAYLATPDEGLVETRDGGQTWSALGLALEEDAVTHLAIHPEDPQLLYAGTLGEDLLRSRDGGQSWQALARSGQPVEE